MNLLNAPRRVAVSFFLAVGVAGALAARPSNLQGGGFPDELREWRALPARATAVTPNLRQTIECLGGGSAVRMKWNERNPDPQISWQSSEVLEKVSFLTTCAATRQGGNETFVAGINKSGKAVVEKWIYPVRKGGYHLTWNSGPPLPIGDPMPAYVATEEVFNSPSYLPPGKRVSANRTALYEDTDMGQIRKMVCDPEGRALYVLSYPLGDIYRIDLIGNPGDVHLLYTAAGHPALGAATTMRMAHHSTEGRVVILSQKSGAIYPVGHKRILLNDLDNDAKFDTIRTLSSTEWKDSGYADSSVWKNYETIGTYSF